MLARVERIAEKVRAFLERGLDRDAFDLHYHARGLSTGDRTLLRDLIQRKLESGDLPDGCDARAVRYGPRRRKAGMAAGLVIVSDPPEWTEVERLLDATYKPLLRNPLRRR